MAGSKNRLLWDEIPAPTRAAVEGLIGGRVVTAVNCHGGFSPGLAARMTLADGRRVFVKAIDGQEWPGQAGPYRAEAVISAALPPTIPAPQFLGSFDDGRWIALAFEHIDGAEPSQPWRPAEVARVMVALDQLAELLTPSPLTLGRDHSRLGGWAEGATDEICLTQLPRHSAWAADHLQLLVELEEVGQAAAQGDSLVHLDLYAHNILLAPDRVVFIDWPYARLGAPIVDLVMLLSSMAADGIDPEPLLRQSLIAADLDPRAVDGIIAANAGFLLGGGLYPPDPGTEPIIATKLRLGHGALDWLKHRLSER